MLTQCYLGELYKRGSLPVPAQLLPRAEEGGRAGSRRQESEWAGADGLRRQEGGWSGAGGHFPGQGGGWQGENGCGGGGRVSGGSGCTGRGTEEGGRAGSQREDDDSTRASDRGTGSRRQEGEWAGADGLRRQEGGRAGAGGHFAGQEGGRQGEDRGGGGGRVSGGPGCNARGTEEGGHFAGQGENGCGGGGQVSGGPGCTGRGTEEGGRAGSRQENDDSTRASDRGTGSRRQEGEWAGYEGSEREAIGNDARLDPGTAARIAKAARWLTGDHRPGLLLYGTVGSGKSTLARAICELIGILHDSPLRSERLAVARTSAPELVELKAAREVRAAADSEELFARLRGAPMLLIDDLGVEAPAVRSWGNCLTPVIDLLYYRYDRRLFTIVTSNLDQEAIEATYGVRIADRMAEMFDRIGHAGPSYRR